MASLELELLSTTSSAVAPPRDRSRDGSGGKQHPSGRPSSKANIVDQRSDQPEEAPNGARWLEGGVLALGPNSIVHTDAAPDWLDGYAQTLEDRAGAARRKAFADWATSCEETRIKPLSAFTKAQGVAHAVASCARFRGRAQ